MPGVPPVPIPNTAVKPRAANGSRTIGPARVGCCQVYDPELLTATPGLLFSGAACWQADMKHAGKWSRTTLRDRKFLPARFRQFCTETTTKPLTGFSGLPICCGHRPGWPQPVVVNNASTTPNNFCSLVLMPPGERPFSPLPTTAHPQVRNRHRLMQKTFQVGSKTFVLDQDKAETAFAAKKVINGRETMTFNLLPLKYQWAYDLYRKMKANHWEPEDIPMGKDIEQWRDPNLVSDQERWIIRMGIGYFSAAEGIVGDNIQHVVRELVTAPELKLVLGRHAHEENIH